MHRPPFPRTQRRARLSRCQRSCRTLKNWLPRHRPSRRRPRWRSRHRRRRLVHRARAGLRHDHSRQWRTRRRWLRRSRSLHLRSVNKRRKRCRWRRTSGLCGRSHSRNSWRNGDGRRCWSRAGSGNRWGCGWWSRRNFGWNHDHRRRAIGSSYRSWRDQSRGRRRRRGSFARGLGWHCHPRHGSHRGRCLCFHRGRRRRNGRLDCRTRRRMLDSFLLLRDGAQHISRPRNMREVDLGLDLVFAASGTRGLRRTRRRVGSAAEILPHQFRFVFFQRTGVRFLLRDAHRGQHVKNFLALDFQLTGQIVDSNLTHPPSFPVLAPLLSRV
jgi:hypothetical protein